MKLFFTKEQQGEITLEMQKGTDRIDFDYVEMIRQLMENNVIDEPDFDNLDEGEKEKVKSLLDEIKKAVDEEMAET